MSTDAAVNIIGAGLSGLSAAISLAERGIAVRLVSQADSERAASCMAEGGINAVLDTMGEGDEQRFHYEDTIKSGAGLCDEDAVRYLTESAPEAVAYLAGIGVPFHREGGRIVQRNFGGQKKKRTAYAKSSTGKAIMSAMIAQCRKYEAEGSIRRYSRHEFLRLLIKDGRCCGVRVRDRYTGTMLDMHGSVIICSGGLCALFYGRYTGSVLNDGSVAAALLYAGVRLANLEMLQYHPTTIALPGKRGLISEAARGEGGRLFIKRKGKPWYFMEEKYPELKNLMPRDVVAREMVFALRQEDCEGPVYLDMRGIGRKAWEYKLSDLRDELIHYLSMDPASEPVAVEPGLHYSMGGIYVDSTHCCSMDGLYAAGEAAAIYHGANRLGGNSLPGAFLGGRRAAENLSAACGGGMTEYKGAEEYSALARPLYEKKLGDTLYSCMGIVRSKEALEEGLSAVQALAKDADCARERDKALLAEAMIRCALLRSESRGAHYREDAPEPDPAMDKPTSVISKRGSLCPMFL